MLKKLNKKALEKKPSFQTADFLKKQKGRRPERIFAKQTGFRGPQHRG